MAMIVPPATIGMLGGGQLGRYALIAARQMGFGTIVLDPDPHAPAGAIADVHLIAPFDEPASIDTLAERCAVVTTEFENAPAAALERLTSMGVTVAPNPRAVAICQDRRAEKRFLAESGAPIGQVAVIEHADDLATATTKVGFPAILKTARLGYDGKGQRTVAAAADLADAWVALGEVPCVLEERLVLDCEVSVVLARSADGSTAVYPVAENRHANGILDVSLVPARISHDLATRAITIAVGIAEALDYVGVLAVEMFVVDGELFVNEMAPRPHNSGHWTLDGAATSQFEQQIRAVCGHALGPSHLIANAGGMLNLLGDRWSAGEPDWAAALANPAATLHLYGKREPRPGRKMGHLTATAGSVNQVESLLSGFDTKLR